MTDSDFSFAIHHQAAHVVTAVMLGYRVGTVSPTGSAVEEDWGILDAGVEDVTAVCAAGFAMERILGRNPEEAWARCKNDRSLLAAIYADQTGTVLDEGEVTDLFYRGVESSEAILRHSTVQKAIDAVAASLSARFNDGQGELVEEDVRGIVARWVGLAGQGTRELVV